ncbi:hypothetical protein PPSQR21_001460 [Paenibacillus polymyxa SQR-21]|nr:hypothetical protein PPSQR21_001460 [Paenibacillus polymyxa SQR-21]
MDFVYKIQKDILSRQFQNELIALSITNFGWSLMESLILAQDERWRRA